MGCFLRPVREKDLIRFDMLVMWLDASDNPAIESPESVVGWKEHHRDRGVRAVWWP